VIDRDIAILFTWFLFTSLPPRQKRGDIGGTSLDLQWLFHVFRCLGSITTPLGIELSSVQVDGLFTLVVVIDLKGYLAGTLTFVLIIEVVVLCIVGCQHFVLPLGLHYCSGGGRPLV